MMRENRRREAIAAAGRQRGDDKRKERTREESCRVRTGPKEIREPYERVPLPARRERDHVQPPPSLMGDETHL